MRRAFLLLLLSGCGPVRLGEEPPSDVEVDAGGTSDLDADSGPSAVVTVRASGGCNTCYELVATGVGGTPPYSFEWEDGLRDAMRTVCPGKDAGTLGVTVRDSSMRRSAPHVTQLESSDAGCAPPAPQICLTNPSFEGTPAINLGTPVKFDAPPWSDCTNPMVPNLPQIINDTVQQMVGKVPNPTNGSTILVIPEDSQASEKLCRSIQGGRSVSFTIDVARATIADNVNPQTEAAFLEIWGGVAADCSRRENLWASPPLANTWQTYCVTLGPQQFTDNIVLAARSDKTLASSIAIAVDNMKPVTACP